MMAKKPLPLIAPAALLWAISGCAAGPVPDSPQAGESQPSPSHEATDTTDLSLIPAQEVFIGSLGNKLEQIWGWDALNKHWLLYDPRSVLLSDLVGLVRGSGYWVKVTEDVNVPVYCFTYTLYAGWNLIGWLNDYDLSCFSPLPPEFGG
jgi:hypothetical protein